MLFIYIVGLILISLIINDLMSVSSGGVVYALLITKWVSIFSLLSLISFSLLKIFNIATNPFEKKKKKLDKNTKRDRILSKEKLYTQSDLIMQKYMKE